LVESGSVEKDVWGVSVVFHTAPILHCIHNMWRPWPWLWKERTCSTRLYFRRWAFRAWERAGVIFT